MAAIDYGTVVFKNGKRYKPEDLCPVIDELGGIVFYKCSLQYDDTSQEGVWFNVANKISFHFEFAGASWHVKKICPGVYHARGTANGDLYDIIFGCGIDSQKWIWNEFKVEYLGKKNARKVDKILAEYGY